MHLEQLRHCLDSLDNARDLLRGWGVRDLPRGWRNLSHLAERLGPESLRDLATPLGRILPRCPDPDMALNNLERFFDSPAGPAQLPALLENRARTLEVLLQLLGT